MNNPSSERSPGERGAHPARRITTGRRLLRSVVLADGDVAVREDLAKRLRVRGWAVKEAATGEEAIFLAGVHLPDAIVVDVYVPGIAGAEVCRRLRGDDDLNAIAIVACAGGDRSTRIQAEVLARRAGCDAFIAKPFAPIDVRVLLERLVVSWPGLGNQGTW